MSDKTNKIVSDLYRMMSRHEGITYEAAYEVAKCVNPDLTMEQFKTALSAQ